MIASGAGPDDAGHRAQRRRAEGGRESEREHRYPLPDEGGRRVALVIGNAAYLIRPNSRHDAVSIADARRRLGFRLGLLQAAKTIS
jgi:hypothetical protein